MEKWRLEKDFRFEAAHSLKYHDGKCKRLHGHSFVGKIIVEGPRLEISGPKQKMLLDFTELSDVLKPIVDNYLDHWYLNTSLETDSPTSEFIAKWVYDVLIRNTNWASRGIKIVAVEISETCTSRCTYIPNDN